MLLLPLSLPQVHGASRGNSALVRPPLLARQYVLDPGTGTCRNRVLTPSRTTNISVRRIRANHPCVQVHQHRQHSAHPVGVRDCLKSALRPPVLPVWTSGATPWQLPNAMMAAAHTRHQDFEPHRAHLPCEAIPPPDPSPTNHVAHSPLPPAPLSPPLPRPPPPPPSPPPPPLCLHLLQQLHGLQDVGLVGVHDLAAQQHLVQDVVDL